jgi:hypothetical protein
MRGSWWSGRAVCHLEPNGTLPAQVSLSLAGAVGL